MNYSKFQKIISIIILPFFLFSLVFRFPFNFIEESNAGDTKLYSLVSILVNNDIYKDIKTELERYASDISKKLENTKIVIIPAPKNASSFKIASLNEKLYFEGYRGIKKSANFKSKLVGSVFVGDFSIPVVYNSSNESTKTILPYIDFIDKSFIYNHKTKRYEKNKDNINGIKAEIWHGFISPNLGDKQKNIQAIKDYFNKNHNFYSGNGNFKKDEQVINGLERANNNYKPYVFYFDEFREQKALSYAKYLGYDAYIKNKEDIVYKRYSKELAEKIQDSVLSDSNEKIKDLIKDINPGFSFDTKKSYGPDVSVSPDILTKYIIDKTTKKFIETINTSKIGEFRENVNNAGRYSSTGGQVNVDFIPYLISSLDEVEDNIIKGSNFSLEKEINKLVIDDGLSRKIAIPTFIHRTNNHGTGSSAYSCEFEYENILYGKLARNIKTAKDCSIYLGSDNGGQIVEANRGINIKNIEADIKLCNKKETSGYWGGNSPINLDMSKVNSSNLKLKSHNLFGAIRPIFEVQGSYKIDDNKKIASPLDCFNNNFFVSLEESYDWMYQMCTPSYQLPINGKTAVGWTCGTNNKKYSFNKSFIQLYKETNCGKDIYLDGKKICSGDGQKYHFKTIPSYIKHISPTYEELNIQNKYRISPNLGIDKNRYIDFIAANGDYTKINYPYLFRINKDLSDYKNFDEQLEAISKELDEYLNKKSDEINKIIKEKNPSELTGVDLEIYKNFLKISDYPSATLDLLKIIKSKGNKTITIAGETKELSYYDSLVFAIFWNNLNSIGQKYKFIVENYLSDQTNSKYKYFLAKNKKLYEIAYLGAPGDPKNMYIKLDPKEKGKNPYSKIISLNAKLFSDSLTFKFYTGNQENKKDGVFKCAPPEGVNLWEWPQAVFCRLKNMMPPKIKITTSKCSSKTLFKNEDDIEETNEKNENLKRSCENNDLNKNGIEDCLEDDLKNAHIELISSTDKSYILKHVGLKAKILNSKNELLTDLYNIKLKFKLLKIEAKKDKNKDLKGSNIEVVYDANSINEISDRNKNKFIFFKDGYSQTQGGIAQYYLNTKDKEANYYFQTELELRNNKFGFSTKNTKAKTDDVILKLKSNILKLEVRKDLFTSSIARLDKSGKLKLGGNDIVANNNTNIYLIDGNKVSLSDTKLSIAGDSISNEKLVISLNHYSKTNKEIPLSYPLKLSIYKGDKKVLGELNIIDSSLDNFKAITGLEESGDYTIKIVDKYGYVTKQRITIIPDIASKIDLVLATNVLEKSGLSTHNIVILKDKYGNLANTKKYNVILESKGNFSFPLNDGENLIKKELNIYNGYKGFVIKPGESSGVGQLKVTLKDNNKILASQSKSIQIINKINFDLDLPSDIKVGNNEYKIKVRLKDAGGNLIKNLNTRIYFSINNIYVNSNKDYFEVKSGEAEIVFKTKILAGKDIPFELQIEGLREIYSNKLTINPEKPIMLNLVLSNSKLKASKDSKTNLRVELKDIYGNVVFNDNQTRLKLEIHDNYKNIIKYDGNVIKKVISGISNFELKATSNPGVAYFKVSTIPSLSNNSFKLGDKVIQGVGENAGEIHTYFFWDKDTFKDKKYNALYTVMLGADYGNLNVENYLAGSLLFNADNRNLAITTLLENPYKYNDVVSISKNSKIEKIFSNLDLTQDIEFSTGLDTNHKLFINLFNKSLNTQIARIFYNFSNNIELRKCETTIGECNIDKNKNSINLKLIDSSYNIKKSGDKIILEKSGNKILTINSKGEFYKNSIISFELLKNTNEDFLIFNIKNKQDTIAKLILNTSESKFIVSRTNKKTQNLLKINNNLNIIQFDSYEYGIHKVYNSDGEKINIFYNNPFSRKDKLNSFAKRNLYGIENFKKEEKIGWGGDNKFLLNFSAGENVGESTKIYQSIGMINLGDPVISLTKIRTKFNDGTFKNFDSTIGKIISNDDDIVNYKIFDYDNDNRDDILLIKSDGFFKLLENKENSQKFIDKGNLAFIADSGNKNLVLTGDFTGDGYDDIFFINNKSEEFLLNNVGKDFSRYSLIDQFSSLKGKIVQAEAFDMDNDGKTDITTLDESGEINIFYGGGSFSKPKFTKKYIGNGFGLKLDSSPRKEGSFIYFDGLYQKNENEVDNDKSAINTEFLDRQIFVSIPYNNTSQTGSTAIKNSVNTDDGLSGESNKDLIKFLEENDNINYVGGINNTNFKTFIKSEYSEAAGVKVEKIFKDLNGGNLKSGDIVEVTIKVKNIQSKTISNLVFIDNIQAPFKLVGDKIQISKGNLGQAPASYDILVDQINLGANEEAIIKYKLKTPKLSFGYIKVGLFEEKGTFGDDQYGDIIVSKNNKNCSDNINMYASDNFVKRKYSDLLTKSPSCDIDKLELPDEIDPDLEQKSKDLLNDPKKAQEYAKEKVKELDNIEEEEETTDALNVLDKINEKTEEYVEKIDNLIKGFACGFASAGCIATPLNWAPLAPGQDPTLFGNPIGDGLRIDEGIPVLSALTGKNVPTSHGCYQIPTIWPVTSNKFTGVCNTTPGAGGSLGINSPTNFVRLFITPTLTGGIGTAVCFGGPASIAGRSNPKGVHPIIPGGNCIVVAKPLLSCSPDGSEGAPETMGQVDNFGDFGVINGNCDTASLRENNAYIDSDFVFKYYTKKITRGHFDESFEKEYKEVIKKYNQDLENSEKYEANELPNKPLFSFNGGGVGDYSLQSSINFSNSGKEVFEDVVKVKKKRISPFPSFLMDWATRQAEEIVTKLSDFPTLFVILPDFSGLIDTDWTEHFKKVDKAYDEGLKEEDKKDEQIQSKIDSLEQQKGALNCSSGENKVKCLSLDVKIGQLYAQKGLSWEKGHESGIKNAYEFLSNVPIVEINPQRVNVNIPWISGNSIDGALSSWKATLSQWEQEWYRQKLHLNGRANIEQFISRLRQNIATLESYKEIPRKLSKLFNQKEIRIDQVLCNVESISELTTGWIGRNGERFKAWVQTFILVKAILKSWQLLIDVFIDYDTECHECKNERNDLLNYEFKLIDMVIPKIPIIKFPKWPDLILDLHNIRATINIKVPDIVVTKRLLTLPTLPKLSLPDGSLDVNVKLPSMPLLPQFEVPELPDLPGFPSVELPDLPPPPKLPKIFSSLEGVLKILKLVTKAMCLLKSLPFVPEWRAGDQIAFLTERKGYLPTDFIDISLPQFSLPYVDAIKVTTYVNLEKDTSFLVDIVKNVVEPLNKATNDFRNSFNRAGFDANILDFSDKSINKTKNIDLNKKSSFNNSIKNALIGLFTYLELNKDKKISSQEFLNNILISLSSKEFSESNNKNLKQINNLWKDVANYTFSKEDLLVNDLKNSNIEKFSLIKSILNNELEKAKKSKKEIKNIFDNKKIFINISSNTNNLDFNIYKNSLNKYKIKSLEAAKKMIYDGVDKEVLEINNQGKKLNSRIKNGIISFRKNIARKELLALSDSSDSKTDNLNSCQKINKSPYHYNYKGIYIIENSKSYRLFNYLDELVGNETYKVFDYDLDGDEDLLYFMNNKLYLKENLKNIKDKDISNNNIYNLAISDNNFFNGLGFIEAINSFKEINTDSEVLNLSFKAPTDTNIKHFRVEYYNLVDKFLNDSNNGKKIIDAFVKDNSYNEVKKYNVYISSLGDLGAVILNTPELINIKDSIKNNNRVNISATTRLYTGNSSAKIKYYIEGQENNILEREISSNSGISFEDKIIILGITGNLYIRGRTNVSLSGRDIYKYIGLPLFDGTSFSTIPDLKNKLNPTRSHVELKYSNGKEYSINFTKVDSYSLYDLGTISDHYLIRLSSPNDFFYGKIYALKGKLKGTYSKQVLFAPQIEADHLAPELDLYGIKGVDNGVIRIPVYQKKIIDFTKAIFENSGITGLKSIKLELEGYNDKINVKHNGNRVLVTFGKFDELLKTKIKFILEDKNSNISNYLVDFEVYSPVPEIIKKDGNKIIGKIDENLVGEPINIYRIRAGGLKRLINKENKFKVPTTNSGSFTFVVSDKADGLLLKDSFVNVAEINEYTGKIKLKSSLYTIGVIKTEQLYPRIVIKNKKGEDIYFEYLDLKSNKKINIVEDYNNLKEKGLYLNIIDNINNSYYVIPQSAKYSAGAVAIHAKNNNTDIYFKIFPDGRINFDESKYYIKYKYLGENVVLELRNKLNNEIIAEVLYNINASYLMK